MTSLAFCCSYEDWIVKILSVSSLMTTLFSNDQCFLYFCHRIVPVIIIIRVRITYYAEEVSTAHIAVSALSLMDHMITGAARVHAHALLGFISDRLHIQVTSPCIMTLWYC